MLGTALLGLGAPSSRAAEHTGAPNYSWVDKNGERHYGDAVPPEYHIFWRSKIAWFNPSDDLPRHERFRPNTVGLSGTEPPDDSSLTGGGKV